MEHRSWCSSACLLLQIPHISMVTEVKVFSISSPGRLPSQLPQAPDFPKRVILEECVCMRVHVCVCVQVCMCTCGYGGQRLTLSDYITVHLVFEVESPTHS